MNAPIVINNVAIRTNADGLYRLNDIHAGSPVADQDHKKPSEWARSVGAEVIEAAKNQGVNLHLGTKSKTYDYASQSGISRFGTKSTTYDDASQSPSEGFGTESSTYVVVKGGNAPGTYASKDLVYAYAMWLSPEFMLHVIRVFDATVNQTPPAPHQFDNPVHAAIFQLLLAQEKTERELRKYELELMAVGRRVLALEGERKDFLTIMGWCNLEGREISREEAASMGKRASRRCRELGIETGKTKHPVYGEVNTYPEGLLDELFT